MKPLTFEKRRLEEALSSITNEDLFALQCLKRVGLPNKKNEEYRYFDIVSLLQRPWTRFIANKETITQSEHLVITDGVITAMPRFAGVTIAYAQDIVPDANHFDPLYYMGHLLNPEIISIRCDKNVALHIEHRFTKKERLLSYRTALFVQENVDVTVTETFFALEAEGSFVLSGSDIFLARNASLELVKSQTLHENGYVSLFSHCYNLEEDASLTLRTFDFGDGSGLQLFQANLQKDANINAEHLLFAKGEHTQRGTVSKIMHVGASTGSTQKAKTILQDHARGIFDALIKIEPTGKQTVAHQNSQAILLNDGAYMVSKPQLEIYIDDVEASHGSTIGELDEAQLFYLQSRGIAHQEAKKMLIMAFANEMIDAVVDTTMREEIHVAFERAYYGATILECIDTCENCAHTVLKE